MKKLFLLAILSVVFISGCGKAAKQDPAASVTPSPSSSVADTASPAPTEQAPQQEGDEAETAPTLQNLEKLQGELDQTTDEAERKKILAKMQKILEQAEAASEAQK